MNIVSSMSIATGGLDPDAMRPMFRETIRALLIDDDSVDATLIKNLAARSKQLDFSLEVCRTTEDGMAAMQDRRFDVIFVDYWMGYDTSIPFIHGVTTSQDIPCILLTGLDTPEIRRCAFRAGVAGFLAKDELSIQAIESVTLAVIRKKLPASRSESGA